MIKEFTVKLVVPTETPGMPDVYLRKCQIEMNTVAAIEPVVCIGPNRSGAGEFETRIYLIGGTAITVVESLDYVWESWNDRGGTVEFEGE